MKPKPLYQVIASLLQARANCLASGASHADWKVRHEATLRDIEKNLLPSGAGIDNGCKLNFDAMDKAGGWNERIDITLGFHHMNENGFYDGWTEHTLTIRPSLASGLALKISGRNRNEIKDYLYETFDISLRQYVEWDGETERYKQAERTAS